MDKGAKDKNQKHRNQGQVAEQTRDRSYLETARKNGATTGGEWKSEIQDLGVRLTNHMVGGWLAALGLMVG